jgi:hypothetical protein
LNGKWPEQAEEKGEKAHWGNSIDYYYMAEVL